MIPASESAEDSARKYAASVERELASIPVDYRALAERLALALEDVVSGQSRTSPAEVRRVLAAAREAGLLPKEEA